MREAALKTIEYEFVLPSGEKRYEFIDLDNDVSVMHQINLGLKLHGAVSRTTPLLTSSLDDRSISPRGEREIRYISSRKR